MFRWRSRTHVRRAISTPARILAASKAARSGGGSSELHAGTVQGFTAQATCLDNGRTIQGATVKVPCDKQVPGLPARPGAGGGYMEPSLVGQSWNAFGGSLKGLMTWSVNWDGSKGWTFCGNVRSLQGR